MRLIPADFFLVGLAVFFGHLVRAQQPMSLGRLPNGEEVRVVLNRDKSYGLQIGNRVDGSYPVRLVLSDSTGPKPRGMLYVEGRFGYQTIARSRDTLMGIADCYNTLSPDRSVLLRVTDRWLLQGDELRLSTLR